jgi:ABC-type dipeptide/oligopeptide/nickel transport system permease subunit
MLTVLIAVTAFASLIAPFDPSATSPNSLDGPSARHWLGTDSIGRDVLSRLIVGGRTTLLITSVAVFLRSRRASFSAFCPATWAGLWTRSSCGS